MNILILIALVVGGAIYYVMKLDFEIGSGFSEEKNKAREAEYTVVDSDAKSEKKLLK